MSKGGPTTMNTVIYHPPRSLAAAKLDKLLKDRPNLQRLADALRDRGNNAAGVLKILQEGGRVGSVWVVLYKMKNGKEYKLEPIFGDDEDKMRQEIDRGLKLGIYTRATLKTLDEEAEEWRVEEITE